MKIKLLPPARVSRWSGGQTSEIALWPPGSSYASRDFLWRLSSATVECGHSVFTALPDYERYIALLSGSLALSVCGQPYKELERMAPFCFDGADPVESRGCAVDCNLMLRKGRCSGKLISLAGGGEVALYAAEAGCTAWLLYAVEPLTARWENSGCALPENGCLQVRQQQGESIRLSVSPGARAMLAQIRYDESDTIL